jgi:O-antigen/teichoic acid export membrane protein
MAFFVVSALIGARLVGIGVSEATAVFAAGRPHMRGLLVGNILLFAATGASGGALLLSGTLASVRQYLPSGIGVPELSFLGVAIVMTYTSAANLGFLQGARRFRSLAVLTATVPWMYALELTVVWLLTGIDVTRASATWMVNAVLSAALSSLFALRSVRGIRFDGRLMRESIAFGARAWIGTMAGFLNARVDQIVMGFIATETALGVYSVAVNASEVLLYLPMATATVLLPAIAGAEPEQRINRTLHVFRQLTLIGGASIVLGGAAGAPLIPVVFGHAFTGSVHAFLLLLPGALGYSALVVFTTALLAEGLPGRSSLSILAALVLGLALDFALVPPFGAYGAAPAATAAFFGGGFVAILLVRARRPFGWIALIPSRRDVAIACSFVADLVRRRTVPGASA